jgi:hypothetical protein
MATCSLTISVSRRAEEQDTLASVVLAFVSGDNSLLNFNLLLLDVVVYPLDMLDIVVERLPGCSSAGNRLILW